MKDAAKLIGKSFAILLVLAVLLVIGFGFYTSLKVKPAKVIHIGYDINGFDNNPLNPTQCLQGEEVRFYPVEKAGYEFVHWTYANMTGSGRPVEKIHKEEINTSIVLRAVFKPIEYKAYMHIDEDMAYTIDFTADKDIELGAAVKQGYKFVGWKDSNGNIVKNIYYGTVGDRHYWAVWQKI